MVIQQTSSATTLFGVRIPAYALIAYQNANPKHSARYVWVEDVTSCGFRQFKITCMDCTTDEVYSYIGDVNKDSVARAFVYFADKLPLNKIHKPVWDNDEDIRACGPQDRKPQVFDAKRKKPDNTRQVTDRSVVDGCRIGKRTYSREGYYSAILGV